MIDTKRLSLVLAGVLIFTLISPCAGAIPSYPINSTVLTTNETRVVIVPVPAGSPALLRHDDVANYSAYGYGIWQYGPGLAYEKRLDLMPSGQNDSSVTHAARLLHFFTISDIHITDEESPGSAIFFGIYSTVSSGYSPVMPYTTQVLDAAVQTINAQHLKEPFDFGISLGDTANNAQHNELRWYIDVLDGKTVHPDSGVKDDPVPGPLNDYQDEFQAAGINSSIRWYQTLGNHDDLFTGFLPQNDYSRKNLLGVDIINLGNVFKNPAGIDSRGYYMGSINGSTPNGTVYGTGPNSSFAIPPTIPAADPDRRSLSTSEFMNEFFTTTTNPAGHGFSPSDVTTGFACYSFEPRPDIPIRIIVLDDTQKSDDPIDPGSLGLGHGTLDRKRYDWLVSELDRGQAEGKLMIIAAHIPIDVWPAGNMAGWSSNAYITEDQLIARLHTYPNLLMWIAGHNHENTVTAFPSPDPARPELGFWEVQTASLRDYPQQYRTFEIYRNSDNTISILVTDVDPSVADGSPAAKSRSYGIAAQEIFSNARNNEYNAELVKPLSPPVPVANYTSGGPASGENSDFPFTGSTTVKNITEIVNAGGGSAVTRAEVTGTGLGKNLVITAMEKSLPATMTAPSTTVFQYISITTSTIPGVVGQVLLDFSVPQSWLTEHGFAAGDIVMMHYAGGQWQVLDTRYVSQQDGNVMYQATSPGLSYFAIAYQKGGTVMGQGTPEPTLSAREETPVPDTPVPVPTTTEEPRNVTPAPAIPPASPVAGISLTPIIAGVIGIIAIITVALLVRRWLIRRQNPELFRKYD